jgi:hypothetical protein
MTCHQKSLGPADQETPLTSMPAFAAIRSDSVLDRGAAMRRSSTPLITSSMGGGAPPARADRCCAPRATEGSPDEPPACGACGWADPGTAVRSWGDVMPGARSWPSLPVRKTYAATGVTMATMRTPMPEISAALVKPARQRYTMRATIAITVTMPTPHRTQLFAFTLVLPVSTVTVVTTGATCRSHYRRSKKRLPGHARKVVRRRLTIADRCHLGDLSFAAARSSAEGVNGEADT